MLRPLARAARAAARHRMNSTPAASRLASSAQPRTPPPPRSTAAPVGAAAAGLAILAMGAGASAADAYPTGGTPLPSPDVSLKHGNVSWGQLEARLRAGGADVTFREPATNGAGTHAVELRAAPGADLHAVLVALAAAFCDADAVRVSADDAPSATRLALDATGVAVEISVPRLQTFDSVVVVELSSPSSAVPPSLTEAQALALERAAAVCRDGEALHRQTAVYDTDIYDAEGNHVACRNPRHPLFGSRSGPDSVVRAPRPSAEDATASAAERARSKLAELGVDVIQPDDQSPTWAALAGYDVVKRRIEDSLVLPLRHPGVYEGVVRGTRARFESNVPKAVLYAGPPGCGKTLSARILAASVGVPFVHVPLETLLSKFYGETTQRLAAVLAAANDLGRCVVFFDEVDSLAHARGPDVHEVTRRTLSVLLRFIDGIDGPQNAVLLAATNHADSIDPALLSRFDVVVEFPLPDEETRAKVIALYAQQLDEGERGMLARITDGFSGREILDSCEEAERTHAGRIVREGDGGEGSEGSSLPRLRDYIDAVKAKAQMSVSAVQARNERKSASSRRDGKRPSISA